MSPEPIEFPKPPLTTLLFRGVSRVCPHCGQGALFEGYVKLVPACAVCGQSFAHIHADDAPPWLTIVVVGHIMISLVMAIEMNFRFPIMYEVPALVLLAVVLTAMLLPVCKGVCVAVLWTVTSKDGAE